MNAKEKELDSIAVIERYIILLLGVLDRSVPTQVHLQKELFVLSKSIPKIGEYIIFVKHILGPYSDDLNDISNEPINYVDAIKHDPENGYSLTENGKDIFKKIVDYNKDNEKFKDFLLMVKMVRELYDKLSTYELLFLIYTTYNEYTEYSGVSDRLLTPKKRLEFSKKLLNKGLITENRFNELVGAE